MNFRPLDLFEKLEILKANDPYMSKERIKACYFDLHFLASILGCFLKDENPSLFFERLSAALLKKNEESDTPQPSLEEARDDFIGKVRLVTITMDTFNYELIKYLRKQPQSYIKYLKMNVSC